MSSVAHCLCLTVFGEYTTRTAFLDEKQDRAGGQEEPLRRLLVLTRISGAQRT